MPYITASIILQLLTVVVPSLEKLQKEGEVGQQRITQYTRYLTVGLAAAQSVGYVFLFHSLGSSVEVIETLDFPTVFLIVVSLTAGTVLADVDGRADHPARDRQRHLADDLRHIVAGLPSGVAAWWNDPGPGLRGDDAVPRARRDRGVCSSRRASAGSRSSTPSA